MTPATMRQAEPRIFRPGIPAKKPTHVVIATSAAQIAAKIRRRKGDALARARKTRRFCRALALATDLDREVQDALMTGHVVSVFAKMGEDLTYAVTIVARREGETRARPVGSETTRAVAAAVAGRLITRRSRRTMTGHTMRFDLESPVTSATMRAIEIGKARVRAGDSARQLRRRHKINADRLLREWDG